MEIYPKNPRGRHPIAFLPFQSSSASFIDDYSIPASANAAVLNEAIAAGQRKKLILK
jgi:hypothetical protein